MKKILNIAFLLFFVIGVSSCAKEELDAPADSAVPQAVISADEPDILQDGDDTQNATIPLPTGINDDGDNEDEGINKNTPSDNG